MRIRYPAPIPAIKPGTKDVRYVPTYFPSSTDPEGAALVDVGIASNSLAGTIKMRKAAYVHLRGKLLGDPAHFPGTRILRLSSEVAPLPWTSGANVQPDGSFDLGTVSGGT